MEAIRARALETENRVRTLETDGMQLQLHQTLMSNLSTQSTLLLGFALATFGADLLPYILDSEGEFCVYKSSAHMAVGTLFLTANTCTVCLCLLTTIFSSLLITRSQEAYLHVGGQVAVFRMKQFVQKIYRWHGSALLCFLISSILLMWVFLGLPGYVVSEIAGHYDTKSMPSGRAMVKCLDLEHDDDHKKRDDFGLWVTSANTVLFAFFIFYFIYEWYSIDRTFLLDSIRGEEAVYKEQQEAKARLQLRWDVDLAKYRLDAAKTELRIAKDQKKAGVEVERKVKVRDSAEMNLARARLRLRHELQSKKAQQLAINPYGSGGATYTNTLLHKLRKAAKKVVWSNSMGSSSNNHLHHGEIKEACASPSPAEAASRLQQTWRVREATRSRAKPKASKPIVSKPFARHLQSGTKTARDDDMDSTA